MSSGTGGDVYALPFADGAFDIVSCRFAFHHLQEPARAFAEMVRVARPGGPHRAVRCHGLRRPRQGRAFNAMERHRDPSTVEFRTLGFLRRLFADAGLPEPEERFYGVPAERDRLIAMSFPAGDDRARLRAMIDGSVEGDAMGVGARHEDCTVRFEYPAVVLVAAKGG